MTVENHERCRM